MVCSTGGSTSDDDPNTGAIVGGVVGGILGAILVILIILLICYCYHKSKTGEGKFNRASMKCVHIVQFVNV